MKTSFSLALCLLIFAVSCKKKDPENPDENQVGTLLFHIHTDLDTSEVDAGEIAPDANGRHIQLDMAQYYLSNIQVKKSDGTWLALTNLYVLKTIDEEEYVISTVPAGDYLSVSFDVGLDDATNVKEPSTFPLGSVLADTDMWFGSTAQGHVFMKVQGLADTTAAQTGPVDQPLDYEIGTSAMRRNAVLPDEPFTVDANGASVVHIITDYGLLLEGIDFKTQNSATPFVNADVASQIADNIPGIFSYETE